MECIELNCLCKHMKKVRSSQAFILRNPSFELNKTQFLRVSIAENLLICFLLILKISQNVCSIAEKYKHICFGQY